MTPLLICAYRPRYLEAVLAWLRACDVQAHYKLIAWDNGGAAGIYRRLGLEWHCVYEEGTHNVLNIGKALAMQHLIDVANAQIPEADCYVCMDDDIVVDRPHLDALTEAARRPGLGMIAARFHPFNTVVPAGGRIESLDTCPTCHGRPFQTFDRACATCAGRGTDPNGLRLRTYLKEDRTVNKTSKVAGGLFAVSKSSIAKLSWAPYLYPILSDGSGKPVVYWTEDASLDYGLTLAGLINGYLEGTQYNPAIHLPDLNPDYVKWKQSAREGRASGNFLGQV